MLKDLMWWISLFLFINVYNIIADFSLTKFLEEQKESLSDGLSSAVRQILIDRLGLDDFLLDAPCSISTTSFVNG
jgi:hypothetical protein